MENTAKEVRKTISEDTLIKVFSDKANWNKRISINDFVLLYNPVENMGRVESKRQEYTAMLPVFCFALGKFMWCC